MKTEVKESKKVRTAKKRLPKDVTIKPALDGKYDDQPLFQDKVNRANHILKTTGIPEFRGKS
jgi:hypothetical protein